MSGEQVKAKLQELGIPLNKIAEKLGVVPQSLNQTLNAQDVKTGFIEDLCRVLNVSYSFFYSDDDIQIANLASLQKENDFLKEENKRLTRELARVSDPSISERDSKVYSLWMKFMDITEEMQELYKGEKGE